jgi:O-acetyl-ADP-ribose deacetylase
VTTPSRENAADMNWTFKYGDILDEPADVLVCSANVFLNLSGGVGGAILLRCGPAMQAELHEHLATRGLRYATRGDVVRTRPHGLSFQAVLHAVAVNGLYETSVADVRAVVRRSLEDAAALGARRVAMTALATGYGPLKLGDFAEAVAPLRSADLPPIEQVVVCVRNAGDLEDLVAGLP